MNKKIYIITIVLFVIGLISAIKIYAVNDDIITNQQAQSTNFSANRTAIAKNLLESTGRSEQYSPDKVQEIRTYYGNVYGDERNELIVTAFFPPRDTFVAVYEPVEGGYKFVSEVGLFSDVKNVQFFPIDSLDYDILLLDEYSDQFIGAFEKSSLIRGYLWDNGKFNQVLKLPKNIEASWNTRFDSAENDILWERVTQTTDTLYNNGQNPSLSLTHIQKFLQSSNTDPGGMPMDNTFSVVKERVENEKYIWSDKWKYFIIAEAVETSTGQTVAVLEDFNKSPYFLVPDYELKDKIRILRSDGTTAIISGSAVESPVQPK